MVAKPPAKPTRVRLTSDQRRQQITESARTIFVAHGLAGARTRDIAAEAGINEAMLYRHFKSKEELYEAAVAGPLGEAVAALVATSGEPPAEFDASGAAMKERTSLFLRDLLRIMEDFGPLLGVALFGEVGAAQTYYADRIAPTLNTVQQVIAINLQSWMHRDFDVEMVVHTAFGAAWFHATAARLAGKQLDVDAVADQLTSLFIDGLMSKDGELCGLGRDSTQTA
jgi:AcrR family transcriptional regulator